MTPWNAFWWMLEWTVAVVGGLAIGILASVLIVVVAVRIANDLL